LLNFKYEENTVVFSVSNLYIYIYILVPSLSSDESDADDTVDKDAPLQMDVPFLSRNYMNTDNSE